MPTLFGKRTSDLYIDPLSAVQLRNALRSTPSELTDFSLLHAIASTPDLRNFYLNRRDYGYLEEEVHARLGEFMLPLPAAHDDEYEFFLAEVKSACMLHDWITEATEDDITRKYNIGPGDIVWVADTAEWLMYSMAELAKLFAPELNHQIMLVDTRIKYGIKEDLARMVRIKGVGRKRGRSLHNSGFKDVGSIAASTVKELAKVPLLGTALAESIWLQAREMLEKGK